MAKDDDLEAELTQDLLETARFMLVGSVCIKHNDHSSSGIPDASITWSKRTLWAEVKRANPTFKSRGIQELTCTRLARSGLCKYVIYDVIERNARIVEPRDLGKWRETAAGPFDHRWVVEQFRQLFLEVNP